MTIIYNIILAAAFIYLSVVAYLYFMQRKIIYLPVKEMESPETYGMYETEEVILATTDGLRIKAWYTKAQHGHETILYFQGNAATLGDRTEKLSFLLEQGFGLLAISYRGYGGSEGAPSEKGLYKDAKAALNYLIQKDLLPEKHIVLYGESLGTGVAIELASKSNFRAMILEAPYTSITNRASELHPYIPVKLLIKDKFDSVSKIPSVETPTLIFHGYRDEVMPIHHSRKILEMLTSKKEARFFENVGHTDFNYHELAKITHDFVKNID